MTTQVTIDIGLIAFDIRPRPLADEVTRSLIACMNMLASEFPARACFRLMALGSRKQNTWRPILSLLKPHWMQELAHSWELFLPESMEELALMCAVVICFEGDKRQKVLTQLGIKVVECKV